MDRTDQDMDLAVELINTHWVLASPPDRLTDVGAYQRILRDAGEDALAAELTNSDLQPLRTLREQLRPVFAARTPEAAADALDQLLQNTPVPARLAASDGAVRWNWGAGQHGIDALRARLAAALATQLIRHGTSRSGTCEASPCDCVYIDRSRARTRRYCCDQCNDRAAAAAYRRRAGEASAVRSISRSSTA